MPEGKTIAKILGSKLEAETSNASPVDQLQITVDENSYVSVPGATVTKLQVSTSNDVEPSTDEDETDADDVEPEDQPVEEPEEEAADETVTEEKPQKERAIDDLHAMIGLNSVKESVDKFIKLAKFNKKREQQGLKQISQSLHSVFYGNPGTGKTTVARLVAKAMYEEGVMPKNNYVEVSRQDLVSQNVGGTAIQAKKVLEKALGGVLFIDEAYTLYQEGGSVNWGEEAVDTILKFMEDHRNDLMIIFAGYTKEMQDFINMNPGLESRITNKFVFEDYTPDEIAQIGVQGLKGQQFNFDSDYYSNAVIKAYKADVSHSNGRWIRNYNEKLIRVMISHADDENHQDMVTIQNSDIDELSGGNKADKDATVQQLLQELDNMVGLRDVKDFVHDLVDKVDINNKLGDKLGDTAPTYHMVFAGDPGTGKTTVARIIAKVFYNLGILPKDTVSEVSRPDLVAGYIGQTEEKTSKAIRNALGGVLFVDEAYQLTAQGKGSNDFGRQAVETFITELENNRDKFVAIFAGYTTEMENFLTANPGLRSRIPLTIEFQPYTAQEVAEIVTKIVTKNLKVDETLLNTVVVRHYEGLPDNQKSNGRWARNFADKLVGQHKLWLSEHLQEIDMDAVNQIDDSLLTESLTWNI